MDKDELANRGKKQEAAVLKYLKKREEEDATFTFQRQYDARSAGGRFPSQVGDYLTFRTQMHGVLEVKALAHDFRLPNKNFSAEKIAKCRRREMAGSHIAVLVCHTTTGMWRTPPFSIFANAPAVSSWVLSDYPTYPSAEAALADLCPYLYARKF